uniref:Uncharacterized protein n=1 Tax=Oryza sativa subsp. japonica TaxID=39947 RepID=Q8LMS0_ORYSJ|nr:Hypothetical protein [Oryza sativa Japonica Group]
MAAAVAESCTAAVMAHGGGAWKHPREEEQGVGLSGRGWADLGRSGPKEERKFGPNE